MIYIVLVSFLDSLNEVSPIIERLVEVDATCEDIDTPKGRLNPDLACSWRPEAVKLLSLVCLQKKLFIKVEPKHEKKPNCKYTESFEAVIL